MKRNRAALLGYLLPAVMVGAAVMTAAPGAGAQTNGRLLLQNASAKTCLWGAVDEFGVFRTELAATSGSACVYGGVSTMVPTDAGILAYDYFSGSTWAFRHDALGVGDSIAGPGFSPIWKWAVPMGRFIMLYDGTHFGAVVSINSDLTIQQTDTLTNVSPWTQVISTDNYLFFYNSSTGVYAIAVIDIGGAIGQTSNGTQPTGFTKVVSSRDALFFYNYNTGAYLYGTIVANPASRTDGLYAPINGTLPVHFTHFVALNSNLLCYNVITGTAKVLYLPNSGSPLTVTQTLNIGKFWNFVVAAGANIFLYNESTGATAVGQIDNKGHFLLIPSPTVASGFTNVVATRQ